MLTRLVRFLWRIFGGSIVADPLEGLEPVQTRLIVGLGNPGPEYADTRHNVGFRVVEHIARRHGAQWVERRDLSSLVALAKMDQLNVILAKPQTFMNRSGEAVERLLGELQLEPRRALIVYDDMDLPFGTLRLRERGSPGTHNGMRSVVATLGHENIPRLRIGISQASPGEAINHVLSEFREEEREAVDELVERAAQAALTWAIQGAASAMNRYNKM